MYFNVILRDQCNKDHNIRVHVLPSVGDFVMRDSDPVGTFYIVDRVLHSVGGGEQRIILRVREMLA